ncbi:MAG: hypothetical protein P0S94_00745 [Simkaniaceae bacterium]|nr:hypothetical protein [Simkaniaceae bacterium]
MFKNATTRSSSATLQTQYDQLHQDVHAIAQRDFNTARLFFALSRMNPQNRVKSTFHETHATLSSIDPNTPYYARVTALFHDLNKILLV